MTRLDAAAMARIIADVGAEPANRTNLRRNLLHCASLYEVGILWRQTNKSLKKRLDQIAHTAKRLRTLLNDERVWLEIETCDGLPDNGIDLREIDGLLDRVIESASSPSPTHFPALAPITPPRLEQHLKERSPLEWLIGELQDVFDRHFHAIAGKRYTKDPNDGEIKGARIDFTAAALHELGITNSGRNYSRKTIAAAITLARSGKPRRSA